MANRKRPIQLKFRVTAEERELIDRRMAQVGTGNMAAYLRKMAIDGIVVNLDVPELNTLIVELRRTNNSLNQIAKRVNATGRFYDSDAAFVKEKMENLWTAMQLVLDKLSVL